MPHILIVAAPLRSRLAATREIARRLACRGYRISLFLASAFVSELTEADPNPVLYDAALDPDLDDLDMEQDAVGPDAALAFLDDAIDALPPLEFACTHDPPDLIVYDALAWSAALIAAKQDLPAIRLEVGLLTDEQAAAAFAICRPGLAALLAAESFAQASPEDVFRGEHEAACMEQPELVACVIERSLRELARA